MASIRRSVGQSPIVDTGGEDKNEIRLHVGEGTRDALLHIARKRHEELASEEGYPESFEEALLDILVILKSAGRYP